MIVYGWGGGESVLGEVGTHDCPACKQHGSFSARVGYRYFHIWYLFSFLTGRDYYIQCDNCQNAAKVDKATIKKQFPKDNIPFIRKRGWMIIAIPLAVLFCVGAVSGAAKSKENNARIESRINEPKVNDIYIGNLALVTGSGFEPGDSSDVKKGDKAYGSMKLVEIDEDELIFAVSIHAYSKEAGLRKELRKMEYNTEDLLTLTKEQARQLLVKGTLTDVQR